MEKKIVVNSFNPEFGYELISVVPYAYYLYLHGRLKKTISGKLSEPLYYFSPNHEINPEQRSWDNTVKLIKSGVPNASIHKRRLDTSQFMPPPYKEKYRNNIYKWKKPTICICNRYNNEWGMPPINYFSLDILKILFNLLRREFQIVYFGVDILDEMQDSGHSLKLGDTEFVKSYKHIILYQDLLKNSGLSWNELQMMIFANCKHFITMNGGYSILASYFGGTNFIYCKTSREVNPRVNSFNGWYNIFGGSKIIVSRDYQDLLYSLDKYCKN